MFFESWNNNHGGKANMKNIKKFGLPILLTIVGVIVALEEVLPVYRTMKARVKGGSANA